MDNIEIDYTKEYLKSKLNIGLAAGLLGFGFLSANFFIFLLFGVAYGLSFMFLHDSPWFKKKMEEKYAEIKRQEEQRQVEAFKIKRDRYYSSLGNSRKQQYNELVKVGKDIEKATMDSVSDQDTAMNTRLIKIDELIWTYLKLLCIEQSLEVFIESERQDNLPTEIKEVEEKISSIGKELDNARKDTKNGSAMVISSKERLLNSYTERLDVLEKRLERVDQGKNNIDIVISEQARLAQQVKLIRADAIATRNADALTSRIDASVSHLESTNKWLSELNDFKDVVGDMPQLNTTRIGFGETESVNAVPYETKDPRKIRKSSLENSYER